MDKMIFYSTNLSAPEVSFEDALLGGIAPDKGLYMPRRMPHIGIDEIIGMRGMSYAQVAFAVLRKVLCPGVDSGSLRRICEDAYDFEVPVERVSGEDYIMRLDRGPTASFKDFAARLMARLVQYFTGKQKRDIMILTATSGDTGSAVAQAFFGLENIRVVVLFPKDEVSERQRKQMTTLGGNVTCVSVSGTFDDCQAMVKEAFCDDGLSGLNLSSANSINIGRLIPQMVYYFYGYSRVADKGEEVVFSVPSGNFGDLMGGLLAREMGLPVARFVAAVNENDEFVKFVETGSYSKIVPSRNCVSNAMNVGHPSNLSRLVALYGGQMDETGRILKMPRMDDIREDIFAVSVSDEETRDVIKRVYDEFKVVLEPHGACGWWGVERFREGFGDKGKVVCIETAHPAKFPDEIVKAIGVDVEVPLSISRVEGMNEKMDALGVDYSGFREFLLKRFL
ncbi:MAG: threonine synthase [Candidatus Nanohalarchaeota archaeon]|nr:MAG: threonine synthase [Candidatus Nanohaloarchaeota archaeon]